MLPELTADQVRRICPPTAFDCSSTQELSPIDSIIGQDRAISAIRFGLNMATSGFNIYVSGSTGTGRTTTIKSFLDALASGKETPPDWCYVYNFKDPYCPRALKVPTGMALELQKDMKHTIENTRRNLMQAFISQEYNQRQTEITEAYNKKRETSYNIISKRAEDEGFVLQNTPVGLVFIPAKEGKPLSEEEYASLSAEVKEALLRRQEDLTKELKERINQLKSEESAVQSQLEETDREVASYSISHLFEEMINKYGEHESVVDFLREVEQDIIENYEQFKTEQKTPDSDPISAIQSLMKRQSLTKYDVNVLVNNSKSVGAPVILELNPTFSNLFGRIEKEAQFGALYTDFTMIKGGSLHRANGGYLVIRIEDVLSNLLSWEGLKRTLRDGKLVIEEVGERLGYVATKSLRPEPIPLDTKVVVIGEPLYYYLLLRVDHEFRELFKVKADFDIRMDRTEANLRDYAAVICKLCREENLKHLQNDALAKIIEHSSRLADDQDKLSALFAEIADIIREADFWAGNDGSSLIEAKHVQQAVEQRVYRSNLIQQRINEMMDNGTIIIDTDGERVGQINGLEVIGLGDFTFGRPGRITASVGVGREGLIDIEREAKLGGRLHTKGIMILNGYIMEKYARDIPLSLSARLVFEQSYEEIDGDSASSAELYTLLSHLSNTPIKQYIAVTGSVNQKGEVQAIGGLNEKIEGFFEVCRMQGLNDHQGVMIPASNNRNLMLKEEVVTAIQEGKFHIYPVNTIDEGIEVLTGVKAGKRLEDGSFEPDSINDRVQKHLINLAERLRDFSRGEETAKPEDTENQD